MTTSAIVAPALVIDLAQVTRLAAYPREELFVVTMADGVKRSVSRIRYCALVNTLRNDPAVRLTRVPGGKLDMDTVWMVERSPQVETAAGAEVEVNR